MLDAGRQYKQISGAERIFLTEGLEDDLALENVDAHWPVGVVGWQITAWREGQNRKAKRPFLYQRSRTAPMARDEGLIDRLLVSRKMTDKHFA